MPPPLVRASRASARTSSPITRRSSSCMKQGARARRASSASSSPRAFATTSPSAAPSSSRELAQHHTGGQLSVAPEHNEPERARQDEEAAASRATSASRRRSARRARRPARSSTSCRTSSPGTRARRSKDTIELALYLKRKACARARCRTSSRRRWRSRRRCTTRASIRSRRSPCTPRRDLREKRMMKALIFYWDAQHWPLAREALRKAGRTRSHRTRPTCLVPPERAAERAGVDGPNRGARVARDAKVRGPRERRRTLAATNLGRARPAHAALCAPRPTRTRLRTRRPALRAPAGWRGTAS